MGGTKAKFEKHANPRGESRFWLALLAGLGCLATSLPARSVAGALQAGDAALATRLASEESASEHWDLTARFDSGHALFVRTLLTNAGPGSSTAVVVGQLVLPDGAVVDFQNGRRRARWSASPDGLLLTIGGSELDLHGPERRFSKQSDKQGIHIEARFAAQPAREVASDREPHVAATAIAPVAGIFQVRDMPAPVHVDGVALLRHAWSRSSERLHTRRWLDVIAGDTQDGVVIWGFETPQGERRQWLSRTRGGVVALETTAFELIGEGVMGPEPGYPVPRSLALRGAGLGGSIEFAGELVRMDPMRIIPQPFRWFLSQKTSPRRILSRARLRLEPGAGLAGFDAPALVAITWTNPLP
jgi:hypothetical protein